MRIPRLSTSLLLIAASAAIALLSQSASGQNFPKPAPPAAKTHLSAEDDAFLEDITHRSFQFFWDYGDPNTGITREHAYWSGQPFPAERRDVGSTGATGFGITALC